jgi:hypothetical protein
MKYVGCSGKVARLEGTPVPASGIEPDEPILPEVERVMAARQQSETCRIRPKETSATRLADHAVNIPLSELREWIVEGCRKRGNRMPPVRPGVSRFAKSN